MRSEHAIENIVTHLLELIDSACARENIPYILWGETARIAKLTGDLAKNRALAEIAILASDAPRLSKALNEIAPSSFFCESWLTNDQYPTFTMRFHDLNTTSVNYKEMSAFDCYGIYVEIVLLTAYDEKGGLRERYNHMKELGWCLNRQPYRIVEFRSKSSKMLGKCFAAAAYVFLVTLGGLRRRYGATVFDKRIETSVSSSSSEFAITWNPGSKGRLIPLCFLDTRDTVSVGKAKFQIPHDFNGFMEICDCSFWEEKEIKDYGVGMGNWTSTQLPFSDAIVRFRASRASYAVSFKLMVQYALKLRQGKKARKKLSRYREQVRAVGDQLNIQLIYGSRKPDILEKREAGDFEALKPLFREYSEALSLSRNRNISPIVLDEDLSLIYIETMIACGRSNVARYALENSRKASGDAEKWASRFPELSQTLKV